MPRFDLTAQFGSDRATYTQRLAQRQTALVLTLGPGIATDRGIMLHEENIAIHESSAACLSPRPGPEMACL
ncbi:hypothetical protein [uncultured Sulfitobacter sp.]|uniref:hypothetical protein n=1 Tax=uncultured Sulfitobacter sp. TaxID=191468 RepID=UPI00263979E5|nr:hypothetical protein [uncultured Sulfitobacter sp.]